MARPVYKLRNKRNDLFFSKSSYKFTEEGTKFSNLKTIRGYLNTAITIGNGYFREEGNSRYSENDFEIVKFELVETGVVE